MAGGITALGAKLNKEQNYISAIIGKNPSKNIGDKVARDIESAFNKPHGWLDHLHYQNYTAEIIGTYDITREIPLIKLDEVLEFAANNTLKRDLETVQTNQPSRHISFAVQLTATGNPVIDLPGLTYAVIDTQEKPINNSYVLAQLSPNATPEVFVYKNEDENDAFYPLHLNHKIQPITPPHIIGVVKEIRIQPHVATEPA